MERARRLDVVCECGSAKDARATACERCEYLDGRRDADTSMIQALRSLGGVAGADALQLEMGCKYSQFRRVARRLEKQGRVVKTMEEGWQPHTGGPGAAVLTLVDAGD